jgi:putative ABC transport system ATP-binding protein
MDWEMELGMGAGTINAQEAAPPAAGRAGIESGVYGNGSAGRAPLLIRLEKLCKAYTEAGVTRTILNELDREFYTGEFVALLGKSGSGKSTLLNLISGIDAPTSGDVVIVENGREVRLTALNEHERTLFRRRNIGIVFQFFNLIPTLTVQENVTLPLELMGRGRDARARAQTLLDRVGLGNRLNTYPDKLSGGEQQRVAIARALAHDPLLILADEPTGNLDEDTGETVLGLLLELTRDAGKTLFMATHAPEVAQLATRVLHLDHGHLVSDQAWQETHGKEPRADRPHRVGAHAP